MCRQDGAARPGRTGRCRLPAGSPCRACPRAGRPGRRAFVWGKKEQNTKKATVITDGKGRTLRAGAFRPGRMHDQTAVRTGGIAGLFTQYPQVKAKAGAGYRGLAKEFRTRSRPRR